MKRENDFKMEIAMFYLHFNVRSVLSREIGNLEAKKCYQRSTRFLGFFTEPNKLVFNWTRSSDILNVIKRIRSDCDGGALSSEENVNRIFGIKFKHG